MTDTFALGFCLGVSFVGVVEYALTLRARRRFPLREVKVGDTTKPLTDAQLAAVRAEVARALEENSVAS